LLYKYQQKAINYENRVRQTIPSITFRKLNIKTKQHDYRKENQRITFLQAALSIDNLVKSPIFQIGCAIFGDEIIIIC
jgi:translation initiation factor IF-3